MLPTALSRYRTPGALRDLVLVDVLEITGTTAAAAAALAVSQPSVSRRYRTVASELGLQRDNHKPIGRRFADAAWMAPLRRGVNQHRLACGVLRIGGPPECAPCLANRPWAEWITLGRSQQLHWTALLEQELLDAVALLQLPSPDGYGRQGLVPVVPAEATHSLCLLCRRDPQVLAVARRIGRLAAAIDQVSNQG